MVSVCLNSAVDILHKCYNILNRECLITLYNSFFSPFVNYCYIIWGSAAQSTVSKIDILQKRVLKLVIGVDQRTNYQFVHHKTGVLTVHEIFERQSMIFMYRYSKGFVPINLRNMFIMKSEISSHITRYNDQFCLYASTGVN